MFLLLLYFVPLRTSISQTTEDHKVPLKEKLEKSLSHVNDVLADIEDKIDHERKLLSHIDGDLKDTLYMDYDVTDIWWDENSTVPPDITANDPDETSTTTPMTPPTEVETPPTEVTVPTVIVTLPTLFPQPPPITESTLPEGWPFSTTSGPQSAESLFIEDMKKNMAIDHHGYFSAFIAKLTELIATKDETSITPLLTAMQYSVSGAIDSGKFNSMGSSLVDGMKMVLSMMSRMHPATLQEQAKVLHYGFKHKMALMSPEMNTVVNYYDKLFNAAEGEELFASLQPFEKYPDGGETATQVSDRMLNGMMAPIIRLEGTRSLKTLIQSINEAVQEAYPNWRSQTSSETLANNTPANMTYNISEVSGRRSMNYKRIVKYILAKHPRYFRKLRHKLLKKKYLHSLTHKHKRHHKKVHHMHGRHGRFRPVIKVSSIDISDGTPDTSGSAAFYHESTTTISRTIKKNKLKQRRKDKMLRKRLQEKERQLRYLQKQRRQHKLLAQQRIATKVKNNAKPQYLKQLAKKYLRQKQQGHNKNNKNPKFRRFNDVTSRESLQNSTEFLKDSEYSIKNHMLRKITDFTSHSDEEEYLRSNLHDALRHGNANFTSFRASNYKNQSLWDMTSASDDEWVIKNNIYRVFEQ